MLKIILSVLILLTFTIPAPLNAAPAVFEPETVENNPTLRLEVETRLRASPRQVYFLIENLPLTCTVIRILELENFHARKINSNLFQARDGAGLKGHIYYHTLSDSFLHATGEGTYTSSRLPFSIQGKTSTKINWAALSPERTAVSARLYIRVSNRFLHFTGKVLAPIIRRVAHSKTRNLKNVGRRFFVLAEKHEEYIKQRLKQLDKHKAEKWTEF